MILLLVAGCQKEMYKIESPQVAQSAKLKSSSIPTPSSYIPNGYNYVWGDEFDSNTLDNTKWSLGYESSLTGDRVPGVWGKWHHNDSYAATVQPGNIVIEDGNLKLINKEESGICDSPWNMPFTHTTGMINSIDKFNLNKGYIEVRCKWPRGRKVWPAIWLNPSDYVWGYEWDIWGVFWSIKFSDV